MQNLGVQTKSIMVFFELAFAFRTGQENICFEYTHEVMSTIIYLNICRTKPFKVDLTEILKREFIPAILFCLDHVFCFALFLRE